MNDEIKVSTFKRSGRKVWYMQYRDPFTGDKVVQSTKKTTKRDAERAAAKWEKSLREGKDTRDGKATWQDFRRRYEDEVLPGLKDRTDDKVAGVFNVFERTMRPRLLCHITADMLSKYAAELRRLGRSEATIRGHMAHIHAALTWAMETPKLIRSVPKVKLPKRNKGKRMKGRPITREEFDRMQAKVESVLDSKTRGRKPLPAPPEMVATWLYLLDGLWWSGLRLSEAMELHWTDDTKLRVDFSGRHPMLHIPGDLQKSGNDQTCPIAPEFAELLARTPESEREGFVFNPLSRRGGTRLQPPQVSVIICRIGKAAGVVVQKQNDGAVSKHASAHDLRRSFGDRWAQRLLPQQLKELMRHENIDTTMRYYVGQQAQATAAAIWTAYKKAPSVGDTLGDTTKKGSAAEAANPCFS